MGRGGLRGRGGVLVMTFPVVCGAFVSCLFGAFRALRICAHGAPVIPGVSGDLGAPGAPGAAGAAGVRRVVGVTGARGALGTSRTSRTSVPGAASNLDAP